MTVKKRFIFLSLLVIVLYSAYWVATIRFIENGFMNWITQEIKANQAHIQFAEIQRSGFPFSFTLTVDQLTYAQKQQGMQASIPTLTLNVNPLNWYSVNYAFPSGATITTKQRGETTTLAFKFLQGLMKTPVTKAKTDFELHINDVTVDLPENQSVNINHLSLVLESIPALPRVLSEQTVTKWRTENGQINVSDTELKLDNTILDLSGGLSLDVLNQPTFTGHAVLVNGQEFLTTLSQLGRLPPKNLSMAKSFFSSFEKSFPNPDGDGIKMPLNIKGGFISLGPIPLLPLPQFHWDAPQS